MHCFSPMQPMLTTSHQRARKRRRSNTSSTRSEDLSSTSAAGCFLSKSSSVSSLSTYASSILTSSTSRIPINAFISTETPKKVRFADKSTNEVHVVPNMRRFKFPEHLWWQPNELPYPHQMLRSILDNDDQPQSTVMSFRVSTSHDHAHRLVRATLDLLHAQAKRGGGRVSLRAQSGAAQEYQHAMQAAAVWRGLEPLLVATGNENHVLAVLEAQRQGEESMVDAARVHSRPSSQLAMERARFDVRQAR